MGMDSIFKKLGQDSARMEKLGISENEMVKYYNACGADGRNKQEAFAELVARFKLSDEDAAFAKEVLGNCAPF